MNEVHDARPVVGATANGATAAPAQKAPRSSLWSRRSAFWLVPLLVLVPTAAGVLGGAVRDPVYSARTEVIFNELSGVSATDEQRIATQLALMSSRPVLEPVADQFGTSVEGLEAAVSAERVEQSQILQLTVEDGDQERALQYARGLVDGYLETAVRPVDAPEQTLLTTREQELQQRVGEVQAELAALEQSTPDGVDVETQTEAGRRLSTERDTLVQQIVGLRGRLTDIEIDQAGVDVSVELLTEPYLMPSTADAQLVRGAAAGLLVGILLASGLLVVGGLRRRRV